MRFAPADSRISLVRARIRPRFLELLITHPVVLAQFLQRAGTAAVAVARTAGLMHDEQRHQYRSGGPGIIQNAAVVRATKSRVNPRTLANTVARCGRSVAACFQLRAPGWP